MRGILAVREPLSLDFSGIPAGSLIALVGPIGNGKTTLLESPIAAIHRTFPSRDKALVDYATERDSYIDTQFSLDGRGTFRARVNVDATKRATDAILEHITAHGEHVALNDGRVTTYDIAIAEILPPLGLMLASSFSAQNKAGNFVTLSPKEAKDLFAKMIGLERYEPMAVTAKNAASLVNEERFRKIARRQVIASDVTPDIVQALHQQANGLADQGVHAEAREVELQEQIDVLDARLSMVADQAGAYQSASLRVRTLRQLAADKAAEIDSLVRRAADNDVWNNREKAAIVADVSSQRRDLEERITNNRTLMASADTIREAVRRIGVVDMDLAKTRSERSTAEAVKNQWIRLRREDDQQLAGLAVVANQLTRAQADAGLVSSVPCGGREEYASCQFLRSAAEAKASIPVLEIRLAGRPLLIKRVKALTADISTSETVVSHLDLQIAALERARAELVKQTAHADRLAAAEAKIDEYERQIAGLSSGEADRLNRQRAQHAARAAEISEQHAAAKTTRDALDRDLRLAQDDLLATEAGSRQAVQIQADIAAARRERDNVIATLARVQAEGAAVRRQLDGIAVKQNDLAAIAVKVSILDTELLEWQTLAKAFSRDGLPVLEIDAAGPTVSAYTNDLLHAAFGPRFTVELVTQEAKAGGKGLKESFEIKIFDNEKGGALRDVGDLSGGEQVIVGEAMMNALCVYTNTRSQFPQRTMFRDETVGSLDPSNATKYIAMLRKVVELGGFHHCLYVSHNMAAAALADVQIQVNDGKAQIVYPPFAEAA